MILLLFTAYSLCPITDDVNLVFEPLYQLKESNFEEFVYYVNTCDNALLNCPNYVEIVDSTTKIQHTNCAKLSNSIIEPIHVGKFLESPKLRSDYTIESFIKRISTCEDKFELLSILWPFVHLCSRYFHFESHFNLYVHIKLDAYLDKLKNTVDPKHLSFKTFVIYSFCTYEVVHQSSTADMCNNLIESHSDISHWLYLSSVVYIHSQLVIYKLQEIITLEDLQENRMHLNLNGRLNFNFDKLFLHIRGKPKWYLYMRDQATIDDVQLLYYLGKIAFKNNDLLLNENCIKRPFLDDDKDGIAIVFKLLNDQNAAEIIKKKLNDDKIPYSQLKWFMMMLDIKDRKTRLIIEANSKINDGNPFTLQVEAKELLRLALTYCELELAVLAANSLDSSITNQVVKTLESSHKCVERFKHANEKECLICYDKIEPLKLEMTLCQHGPFHRGCLNLWDRDKSGFASCPICKRKNYRLTQ
eukprot:NODE_13_length_42895_cov_0.518413.p9 type:complete len:472 gc:universal NODE_13_length_42895_cov_0.518413:26813-25398(-)